jgi:hypothetical protein
MRKLIINYFLVLFTLLLIGCSGAKAPEMTVDQSYDIEGVSRDILMAESDSGSGSESSVNNYSREAAPIEPLVIRTANLTIVVEDPSQTADEITSLAESFGGYVVNSNIYQTTYGYSDVPTTRASVTIRVPEEHLKEAIDKIVEDAIEVQTKNIVGQDVTREYTDLQSHLRNLEIAEEQLQDIMDQATKTEDVLNVLDDLRTVRDEIEVIKGRMNYYEDAARLSAVSIELIPDELAQPLSIGGWQPKGTVKSAIEALIKALQFLVDAGIWLVICVAPILLLFGIPGFFIGRNVLRRRRKNQLKPTEEEKSPNES